MSEGRVNCECLQVSVEVLEFPPLPPSPVEEADEESSDVGQSAVIIPKPKSHSNRTMDYRPRVPPHRTPASLSSDSKDHQTSLNTRSMDGGYSRGRRTPVTNNSRREVSRLLFPLLVICSPSVSSPSFYSFFLRFLAANYHRTNRPPHTSLFPSVLAAQPLAERAFR